MLRRLVRLEAPTPTPRPAKLIALEARRQARPETARRCGAAHRCTARTMSRTFRSHENPRLGGRLPRPRKPRRGACGSCFRRQRRRTRPRRSSVEKSIEWLRRPEGAEVRSLLGNLHLDDPLVRLIEVDVSRAAYDAGHIPGAVLWNAYVDLRSPDYAPIDQSGLASLLSAAGVTPETTVVFYGYGQYLGLWLLKRQGHDRVLVMDGGRERWEAARPGVVNGTGDARSPPTIAAARRGRLWPFAPGGPRRLSDAADVSHRRALGGWSSKASASGHRERPRTPAVRVTSRALCTSRWTFCAATTAASRVPKTCVGTTKPVELRRTSASSPTARSATEPARSGSFSSTCSGTRTSTSTTARGPSGAIARYPCRDLAEMGQTIAMTSEADPHLTARPPSRGCTLHAAAEPRREQQRRRETRRKSRWLSSFSRYELERHHLTEIHTES